MTGGHVANHCKQIFSEYGWSETLISINGPCYTSQAFTSVMQSYSVNHITSSLHYQQSNGLAEKYVQILKSFFKCLMIYHNTPLTGSMQSQMQILQGRNARSNLPMSNTARKQLGIQPEIARNTDKHPALPTHDLHVGQQEILKSFFKCLMIYHNTPLTGSMQSQMQILQGRNARSNLPMSNTARKQLGIQPEIARNTDKHPALPTHDLHVGQQEMYQDSSSKCWYPTVITSLCSESRSYKIITRDGIVYRKTQFHMKPFILQNKMSQSVKCVSSPVAESNHMQPVKTESKDKSQVNNHMQVQTSTPKRDTKPPVKLDL